MDAMWPYGDAHLRLLPWEDFVSFQNVHISLDLGVIVDFLDGTIA
jgi:hypothetical protein